MTEWVEAGAAKQRSEIVTLRWYVLAGWIGAIAAFFSLEAMNRHVSSILVGGSCGWILASNIALARCSWPAPVWIILGLSAFSFLALGIGFLGVVVIVMSLLVVAGSFVRRKPSEHSEPSTQTTRKSRPVWLLPVVGTAVFTLVLGVYMSMELDRMEEQEELGPSRTP